LRRKLEVLLST
jgi:hypothetical protein